MGCLAYLHVATTYCFVNRVQIELYNLTIYNFSVEWNDLSLSIEIFSLNFSSKFFSCVYTFIKSGIQESSEEIVKHNFVRNFIK